MDFCSFSLSRVSASSGPPRSGPRSIKASDEAGNGL